MRWCSSTDQITRACRGGATFGGLAAIFYGTQIMSSIARGQRDHRDIMAAGLTTGAAFGVFSEWFVPGSQHCVNKHSSI